MRHECWWMKLRYMWVKVKAPNHRNQSTSNIPNWFFQSVSIKLDVLGILHPQKSFPEKTAHYFDANPLKWLYCFSFVLQVAVHHLERKGSPVSGGNCQCGGICGTSWLVKGILCKWLDVLPPLSPSQCSEHDSLYPTQWPVPHTPERVSEWLHFWAKRLSARTKAGDQRCDCMSAEAQGSI